MAKALTEYFIASVENNPGAEAVVHNNVRMTYGEIYSLIRHVSSYLIKNGVCKGDRVAILVGNSPEYIAIYYAILAVGGVVVALNTQSRAKDINNWIEHSGSKWLFADVSYPELAALNHLSPKGINIVLVGNDADANTFSWSSWKEVLESDGVFTNVQLEQDDIAAIIYTSGTTGHPKGVTLTHGNLVSNIESILDYLKLTPQDSIVNILPFYYSYGNSVLHTHLCSGGRLVLENSLLYPHRVIQKIVDERVSGFSGVPSTFALLLGRVNLKDYDLSCLRYITQAGGAMAPTLTQRLMNELPDTELFIMYGQTEATARLTYLPPEKLSAKRGSVGIAIPGVTIEIVNKEEAIVKTGETGEICAKGNNIMYGYWNDSEGTSKVIKDGWLHTGDLAHYDSDGYIYIDGRSSDMIKTGANRISPKEIEEVIQELVEVQEVAVVGVPDDTLGEIIKAFIVTCQEHKLEKIQVKLHCKNNLATYKIPKQIEFVCELPKTASGKIQKYLLSKSG